MLEIKEVAHGTTLYETLVDLRYRILRQPLNLYFTEEQLMAEKSEIHLAAMMEHIPVGCVLLSPQDTATVKLRQMAVEPEYRDKGIGKTLLAYAEETAQQKGCRNIVLHAREDAVRFYEHLGYSKIGEPFTEIGIPHQRLDKALSPGD